MKKNILIAFLLFISIYSRCNNLTIQPNDLRSFTSSSHILMNDQIFYQQVRGDSINSVAKDGVRFYYSFGMRYHTADNNCLVTLQNRNGNGYANNSIHPEIIEIMNKVFVQFEIEEIYSLKRKYIETLILKKLRSRFEKEQIKIDLILLRSIDFSKKLKQQIYERLLREEEEKKANINN